MIDRQWVSTDQYHTIPSKDRIPDFDGNHYWVVIVTYNVNPENFNNPEEVNILDRENLVMLVGPGCFHCEKDYTPELAKEKCDGDPIYSN